MIRFTLMDIAHVIKLESCGIYYITLINGQMTRLLEGDISAQKALALDDFANDSRGELVEGETSILEPEPEQEEITFCQNTNCDRPAHNETKYCKPCITLWYEQRKIERLKKVELAIAFPPPTPKGYEIT